MAKYVDGFVLVIPKDKKTAYKKIASDASKVWRKFGALDYKECRADDMNPQFVTFTFPKMAKAKEGEEVWFSFITFKSKKNRDSINKKVMKHFDEKWQSEQMDMPFDMKRMAYGGFTVEVE